jgi:hypothetical protein
MKRQIIYFTTILILFIACSGQNPSKEIYNDQFKWTITIPENFETVSPEQWQKMQNKGQKAIEDTYDQKIVNLAKTIFVFRTDELNYFESNYQPFDIAVDGDYLESCKSVNNILFETFMSQMPDIKIDSSSSKETISGLEFQKFQMKIQYPNKLVLNMLLYSRLFDNKEFSVNLMYADKNKGDLMLNSWTNSKFKTSK